MANKTTTTRTLKANYIFEDNDTRIISLDDPSTDVTAANSETVKTKLTSFGQINIGDKTGAAFNRVGTAYIDEVTTTELDLYS